MRGCFIYNKTNGRNLFFPIGASGYGHRKQGYGDMKNWQGVVTGQGYIHGETKNTVVLRYSAGRSDKFNMTVMRNLCFMICICVRGLSIGYSGCIHQDAMEKVILWRGILIISLLILI